VLARFLQSQAGKGNTRRVGASRVSRGSYLLRVLVRYFLWDSIVCFVHYEGVGFLVHGAWTSLGSSINLMSMRWVSRVGLLDSLSQWLCELSFTSLFHSAPLTVSHVCRRDLYLRITVHVSYFGSCT